MTQELYIASFAIDRDGKVISEQKKQPAHSFVQGYIWAGCVNVMSTVANIGPVKDITSADITIRNRQGPLTCTGAYGVPDPGIRVGTGNSAVRVNQYQLDAPIAEGSGAGQLKHQAQTWIFNGVVGDEASFEVTRSFINWSGAEITVGEAGMHVPVFTGLFTFYLLACRDLASHAVPNGGAVTLTYTIRITL